MRSLLFLIAASLVGMSRSEYSPWMTDLIAEQDPNHPSVSYQAQATSPSCRVCSQHLPPPIATWIPPKKSHSSSFSVNSTPGGCSIIKHLGCRWASDRRWAPLPSLNDWGTDFPVRAARTYSRCSPHASSERLACTRHPQSPNKTRLALDLRPR